MNLFAKFEQPDVPKNHQGKIKHLRTCVLCEAMCGIEIDVEDGKIVKIKGDDHDPLSQGYICPKATALQDLYEDKDRLRAPMKRTEEGWKEIPWDQALNEAAQQINRIQKNYGNNAFSLYLGNPNVHNLGSMLMGAPLLSTFLKTENRFSATSVDQLTHHLVAYKLFGHFLSIPIPDLDRTDFFMILGGNPAASNGSLLSAPNMKQRIKNIIQKGGRVVLIDPRRTETADIVSEHHFIHPNADVLLLLGMLHVIARDRLERVDDIQRVAPDVLDYRKYVEHYAPQKIASLVGMRAETIELLAQDFACAQRAVCYGRMGVSTQQFAGITQYLIMLLNIVTGRLDTVGGVMFNTPAMDARQFTPRGGHGYKKSRVSQRPAFTGEFPVSILAEEITTPGVGQIKGLMTIAGNPVLSTPNSEKLSASLEKLEFFVSLDMYINESNRHAHLILPVPSPLERPHFDVVFNAFAPRQYAKWSNPLFAPHGDVKHDWQIIIALFQRMLPAKKQGVHFVFKKLNQLGLAALLELSFKRGSYPFKVSLFRLRKKFAHGMDLGPMKEAQLPKVLKYNKGSLDLCFDYFMPELQRVDAYIAAKPKVAQNQFKLIGRRHVRSNNSWLHNSYRLVKGKDRCTLLMHPDDAARLSIINEEVVTVTSAVGSVTVAVELTESIMPSVVSLPHGWGHTYQDTSWKTAQAHAGVNMNQLTSDSEYDVFSGVAVLNGVDVQVHKGATGNIPV